MRNLEYGRAATDTLALPDAEIVRRVCAGESALFEILMRRHNQRVYRAARAVVKDEDPERQAYAQELNRGLEAAVDTLPETYRTVFMLRDIEGLSTSETGEGLGLGEEASRRVCIARAP
jgi:DNA-directed RNA polymerase specialized sigma24 family protein